MMDISSYAEPIQRAYSELPAEVKRDLEPRIDATNVRDEIERIIRVAMQSGDGLGTPVRCALAAAAAESIRVVTGSREWC